MSCVDLIVANSAYGYEILQGVPASSDVMLDVVQFKVARVGWIPFAMIPAALFTTVIVPHQDGSAHRVGNCAVMRRTLAILFQQIRAYGQVRPAGYLGGYRPSGFGTQFAHSPGPFGSVICDISEFFACNRLADVAAKKL